MWAVSALGKVIETLEKGSTILDIGAGRCEHAAVFSAEGFEVTTLDLEGSHIRSAYLDHDFPDPFDCVWSSHVLEHQTNPGLFLAKCNRDLKDGGLLSVTVPPRKDEIVGGHVTLWNAGLLLYQLILAGFDCSQASVLSEGYDVSVVVRKKKASLPFLKHDHGDIERLAEFFPLPVKEGFNGLIERVNW